MLLGSATAQLPALRQLSIEQCHLGTNGMAYLFDGDWASLQRVEVASVEVASSASSTIALPRLPKRLRTKWEMEFKWEGRAIIRRK